MTASPAGTRSIITASTGYVSSDYLAIDQDSIFTTYGRVPGGTVNVRADATTDSASLATISAGTIVTVNGLVNGWYDVTCQYGTEGYIRFDDLLVLTSNPTSKEGFLHRGDRSLSHLGTRYVYGASSAGGFDCSGFTMYIYKQFGYNLPHSATSQWLSGMGAKIYSISGAARRPSVLQRSQPQRRKGLLPRRYLHRQRPAYPRLFLRNGGVIAAI